MIVCVAEKPNVARDIAKVLGATSQRNGYLEGNGYQVTWAVGHLCSLLDPHDYHEQWKAWNMSSLPMIPERFGIKVMEDKVKQFEIVKALIQQADMVINCGDAGQEGELIQRWIYQKAGCKCPVKRLWTSSLTEEALKEGFNTLKDQSEYQHLYEAGLMRAIGDWLLGMNATRAYTLRYANSWSKGNRQMLSIGRVQTPTLALIVKRQAEIDHFVPTTYYELKTTYRNALFSLDAKTYQDAKEEDEETRILDPDKGQQMVDAIKDHPLTITSVEKKKGVEYAPRLFDLTSLQVECNKKFSFSADETLQLIQSLYEKHITTYPRVDTTFLSEDIYPKVPATLAGIKDYFPQVTLLLPLKADGGKGPTSLPKSKKVFDNKKVTDHHAIIPTGQRPDTLSEKERKVFNLVALRYIAAFYPECQVSTTTVLAEVNNPASELKMPVPFKVTGREILSPGWRTVFEASKEVAETPDSPDENETSETQTLPTFTKGESGHHEPSLVEKTTRPPQPYTEATLLRAMETAGKTVDNEELRDAMKENGIGRPSTRAAIIEKLFQRQYIVRERKSIRPTEIGIRLVHTIVSPLLKSAELTGLWEKKLREIERGDFEAKHFLDELKQMTRQVVLDVQTDQTGMICPVCRRGTIIRGNTRYGCSRWREGCTFSAPFATVPTTTE